MTKFHPGERVLFTSHEVRGIPSHFHAASFGDAHRVMHLSARDPQGKIVPITGTITRIAFVDTNGIATYSFRPDGWDDSNGYSGFQISESFLSPLTDPELFMPGAIVSLPLPVGYLSLTHD